jgi:DNA mismatch repair ATPase MutL
VFEDTKRLIRIRKSKKERQHNGQKKKDKERQHNSQKKRDKERQHNGQKKKDRARQHSGQKKKGKERQHNDQKKKDKERQHNCQTKKDKARQHNGQKKKDKGTNNDLKKIHIQLSNIIFTYLRKPFIFTFVFLFEKKNVIIVTSWGSILLVEETRVPREKHRPATKLLR